MNQNKPQHFRRNAPRRPRSRPWATGAPARALREQRPAVLRRPRLHATRKRAKLEFGIKYCDFNATYIRARTAAVRATLVYGFDSRSGIKTQPWSAACAGVRPRVAGVFARRRRPVRGDLGKTDYFRAVADPFGINNRCANSRHVRSDRH
ncbi:hypothetical protein EVAR_32553_1 [Eumeta japonica]|uniref:Uncharacterized protein n=1 Tax=Eumeta variegata TaxID=151549 RepID=A0A4C1VRE1_EUMVA|nr:hypothetical protein EVAR_32553_1 [Eumeta japonica]